MLFDDSNVSKLTESVLPLTLHKSHSTLVINLFDFWLFVSSYMKKLKKCRKLKEPEKVESRLKMLLYIPLRVKVTRSYGLPRSAYTESTALKRGLSVFTLILISLLLL